MKAIAWLCCIGAAALCAPGALACGETEGWLTPDEIVALKNGGQVWPRQFYFSGFETVADADPWSWLAYENAPPTVEANDVGASVLASALAPFVLEPVPLQAGSEATALDADVRRASDQQLMRVTIACTGHVLIQPTHL